MRSSDNKKRTERWSLVAAGGAVALMALAVGCGERQTAEAPPTTTVVSNSQPSGTTTVTTTTAPTPIPASSVPPVNESVNAGPGGPTGTQAALADEVNKRIIRNPQMTGSRINVVVDDIGVATLTGFTQNQQQKALAAKAAENTTGIVSVTNKLEIRPTGGVGKAPKPAPSPSVTSTTHIIVVPGPPAATPAPPVEERSESPAPAPSSTTIAPETPDSGQ